MKIEKLPDSSAANGTSFHGHMFHATPQQLTDIFGPAKYISNDGEDKVNFQWVLNLVDSETERVFTIYDWKEYRSISMDEEIEWHVGAHDSFTGSLALTAIRDTLK